MTALTLEYTAHHGLFATPRIFGLFHREADVDGLQEQLHSLGVPEVDVHTFYGEEGLRRLDPDGYGFLVRMNRFIHGWHGCSPERREIEPYIQAIHQGEWLVEVACPEADPQPVLRAFYEAQASRIDHYSQPDTPSTVLH